MNFLLKYPTRGRPQQCQNTIAEWERMLSCEQPTQWLLNVDTDDTSMQGAWLHFLAPGKESIFLNRLPNHSKIEAINAGMSDMASQPWQILILVSDDMIPVVKDFDLIIAAEMEKHFPNLDGCLFHPDGFQPQLMTQVIMGRACYERQGFIYNPVYKSFFVDNELQETLEEQGKLAHCPGVLIEHRHWLTGKMPYDETYARCNADLERERPLYESRKAARLLAKLEREKDA